MLLLTLSLTFLSEEAFANREVLQTTVGDRVREGRLQLVVATVLAVEDSGATRGRPPRVRLRIDQVFRDHMALSDLQARWWCEIDPFELRFRCGNESKEETAEWSRYYGVAVTGPAIGSRWIIGGRESSRDSIWDFTPAVRRLYTPRAWEDVKWQVRDAERRAMVATTVLRRDLARRISEDDRIRAEASLARMCAASDEVILGRTAWTDESVYGVDVRAHLKSAPVDTSSEPLWARPPVHGLRGHASSIIVATPRDSAMFRRRIKLPVEWQELEHPEGTDIVGEFVMFLRRGPLVPWFDSARRIYWAADADNALIRADSATVRAVRLALAKSAMALPRSDWNQPECGARLEQFLALSPEPLAEVQVSLDLLQAVPPERRVRRLLLARDLVHVDETWFAPCSLPGPRYWHSDPSNTEMLQLGAEEARATVLALGEVPALIHPIAAGEPVASLRLRGSIAGTERICEVLLGADALQQVVDAMSRVLDRNTYLAARLTAWKGRYADLMVNAADPGLTR